MFPLLASKNALRTFDDLMDAVTAGNFPVTPKLFLTNYLTIPSTANARTSQAHADSIAPSSVFGGDSEMASVDGENFPVVKLSDFSRFMLQDTTDFCCHLWEPNDALLLRCLRAVVTDTLDKKLDALVTILNKLRDMTSYFLMQKDDVVLPRRMDEVTEFQPLVKRLLVEMVNVLLPNSTGISINPCQRNADLLLSKLINVKGTTKKSEHLAVLRGESDLARNCLGELPRYIELKVVGGALYRQSAWKEKDQALGQTVCSSTANKERVVAIGALMDLFTVSVIVTVPVEGGTNVASQMSKRITDARSWVLRVALLLVAPTDSILQLIPPSSDDSIIKVHSEDAVDAGVGVGGLNLASTSTSDGCGATGSSSSSAPQPSVSGKHIEEDTEVDADDCNWLAREALRDRHEEKVRQMLEADALLDGFCFLSEENLDNTGRTATIRPRGDPCRAFGDSW